MQLPLLARLTSPAALVWPGVMGKQLPWPKQALNPATSFSTTLAPPQLLFLHSPKTGRLAAVSCGLPAACSAPYQNVNCRCPITAQNSPLWRHKAGGFYHAKAAAGQPVDELNLDICGNCAWLVLEPITGPYLHDGD